MRPNFYVLEYFHHKLATLVAPSTEVTARCLVRCKEHLLLLTNNENSVQIGALLLATLSILKLVRN